MLYVLHVVYVCPDAVCTTCSVCPDDVCTACSVCPDAVCTTCSVCILMYVRTYVLHVVHVFTAYYARTCTYTYIYIHRYLHRYVLCVQCMCML